MPDPEATKAYTAWALRICGEVERAAAAMHERGVVFNDLHMFNIIVRPDGTVAFIDFEAASDVSEGRTRTVGNPGFAAPRDRAGFDVDAYSLACLRLAMFMPLTTLFALDRDKAAQLAGVIAALFPVPEKFLDEAVREITRGAARPARHVTGPARASARLAAPPPATPAARAGTVWRRTWWARSGRARPRSARTGSSLAISTSSASLAAVSVSRTARPACCTRCPRRPACACPNTRNGSSRGPQNRLKGTHLGLYDGLAGVAYTLARLGHLGRRGTRGARLPRRELGPARPRPLRRPVRVRARHDLRGRPRRRTIGWPTPGYGPRRPSRHRMRPPGAAPSAERAAAGTGGAVGLLRGASGKALLFIRLYERTGDPAYLDAAEAAIADDLRRCVTDGKGALQVDDGWRTLPYLGGGSVGIGMVIDQFTAHRRNEEFADAARAIRLAASSGLYAQAGLFNGRAGMIAYLAGTRDERGQEAARRVAGAHVDRLAVARRPLRGRPGVPRGHAAAPVDGPGHRRRRCPAGHGRRARPVRRGAAVLRPARTAPCSGSRVIPGARSGSPEPASTGKEVNLYGTPRHPGDGPRAWRHARWRRRRRCGSDLSVLLCDSFLSTLCVL